MPRHDSPRFGPSYGLKSPRDHNGSRRHNPLHPFTSLYALLDRHFSRLQLVFSTFYSRIITRSPFIMSQPPVPRISDDDDDDDTSHVSTPVLAHLPASPSLSSSSLPSGSPSSESTRPISGLPSNALLRLPIPTPSANLSQTSFTFVDVSEDRSGVDFNDLPSEVTSADISIAREFLCSLSVSRLWFLRAFIAICRVAYLIAWVLLCCEMGVRRYIPSYWTYSVPVDRIAPYYTSCGERRFHFWAPLRVIYLRLEHVGALKRHRMRAILNLSHFFIFPASFY